MRLSDLQEERARVAKAMRAINEGADKDGKLSDDDARKFADLKGDLEGLEERIQRQQLIDDLDRRMAGTTVHEAGTGEFDRAKRDFSICRLIASTFETGVDAGREREVCAEQRSLTGRKTEGFLVPFECLTPERRDLERRVLTIAGDGSNLVSTTVLGDQFIDALRPMSVATRLGARVLTGLTGDIALPRRDARTPTAAWYTENNAITSGDQSFDQVTGTPRHLGVISEFGRKTMLQATPGIEALTREHLLAELASALDLGVLKGSGAPQPTGITQTSSIGTIAGGSVDPTWANVMAAVATVENADVPMASLGWALNAYAKSKFKQITKVSSDAGAGFLMDETGNMGGAPSAVTSQLAGNPTDSPATDCEAIFGAWGQVIVALWSGMEVLVNPFQSDSYSKGNVSVRGLTDADVLVRHPEAFVYWSAIKSD